MALVNHGLFNSGDGLDINYDYDDITFQILTIHVNNNSGRSWQVAAMDTATQKTYTATIPKNANVDQPIPQTLANRLKLTITPSGKLDGVEWQIF